MRDRERQRDRAMRVASVFFSWIGAVLLDAPAPAPPQVSIVTLRDTLEIENMALKRMTTSESSSKTSEGRLISFANSASSSKGGPRSKENGPDASPDWAISVSRLP